MTENDVKTSPESAEQDYDLTCWYLNQRRVMELVGPNNIITQAVREAGMLGNKHLEDLTIQVVAKDALIRWIREYKLPTLGKLLLSGKAIPGTLFTHYSNFYCKGLTRQKNTKESHSVPLIHCTLKDTGDDVRLCLSYDAIHLTAASSYEKLSGQRQLFVLGAIEAKRDGVLEAFPYIIPRY